MNYEGDFRYVSGEWGDGFEPFERLVGRGVLDADLGPGWRTAAHPVLSSYPEEQRARAACYDVRVPLLHPALRPFRATSQVANTCLSVVLHLSANNPSGWRAIHVGLV